MVRSPFVTTFMLMNVFAISGLASASVATSSSLQSRVLLNSQQLIRRFVVEGYPADLPGVKSAMNALSNQLDDIASVINAETKTFASQKSEIRDACLSFRYVLNTFLSCGPCFAEDNISKFPDSIFRMLGKFQVIMMAAGSSWGKKWPELFIESFSSAGLDGLISTFLKRLNATQKINLKDCVPGGMDTFFDSIEAKETAETIRAFGLGMLRQGQKKRSET